MVPQTIDKFVCSNSRTYSLAANCVRLILLQPLDCVAGRITPK
jgi:hypothetical protein